MKSPVRHKPPDSRQFDGIDVTSRLMNIILEMPLEQQLDLLEKLDSRKYNGTRRFPRTYLKNPWVVTVNRENEIFSDDYYIKDIGRCGMFIEADRTFDVGERVTMQFQMPSSKKAFKIIGKIVRSQDNGIGVKFLKQVTQP